MESMILTKQTTYSNSISLTHEEFESCRKGEFEKIEVRSSTGKLVRILPEQAYSKLINKARLNLVDDDPDKKHYWVVRFS